jgi:hypothetical protein
MDDERMEELEILNRAEADSDWMYSHYEKIREEFPDMFIAVKDKSVLDADKSMDGLIAKLETRGENPAVLLTEFVHRKGVIPILSLS